jgi:hypothetical protein
VVISESNQIVNTADRRGKLMTTYECEICHGVNSVVRLHCKHCGTTPRQYSLLARPVVLKTEPEYGVCYFDEVKVAAGCERQMSRRTIKRLIRTVPMDYYAEA